MHRFPTYAYPVTPRDIALDEPSATSSLLGAFNDYGRNRAAYILVRMYREASVPFGRPFSRARYVDFVNKQSWTVGDDVHFIDLLISDGVIVKVGGELRLTDALVLACLRAAPAEGLTDEQD